MGLRRASAFLGGGVFCAVFLLAAAFLLRPQLVLGDRSAAVLIRRGGAAYRPEWTHLAFSARALGGWRHRYALSARGLCFADRGGGFEACFDELELVLVAAFSRRGARLVEVEQVSATGGSIRLRAGGAGAGALSSSGTLAALRVRVGGARVDLPSVTVFSGKARYSGRLRLRLDRADPRPFSLTADFLRRAPGEKVSRLRGEATAESDAFRKEGMTFLKAGLRLDLGPLGDGAGTLGLRRSARGYESEGGGEFRSRTGGLRIVRLSQCRGTAPVGPEGGLPSEAGGACRFMLKAAKVMTGRVRFDGTLRGGAYSARLGAELDGVKDWLGAGGRFALDARGRLGGALDALEASADLEALLPRFEDLVARLRDTPQAIPAPFHVLKGPVRLKASARGDPRAERLQARLTAAVDLSGGRQRLACAVGADVVVVRPLGPQRAVEVAVEALIEEAAFELPRLDVARVPQAVFDRRIKTGPEAPARGKASWEGASVPAGWTAHAAVRTEKPLSLYSNLVKGPIPVTLDLKGTYPPGAAGGTVGLRTFEIELFRRNAVVDHLNAVFVPGSKAAELEGLVVYKAREAVIRIKVLGTTEKPLLEFSSVPPLKREDILALLIFGKNPAELDPDESSSVGNAEAALESRAFGLASLYLFGATPIEHVAYDPGSRNVSVKLRLPGGARLQLGSDFERSRELRLRQPLAPHWAIQSEFSEADAQSRFGTTFLEWFNRY